MEEIFLKIIESKVIAKADGCYGIDNAATEIADIVKAFVEWKDERLSNDKIIYHNGFYFYAKKYTHDDLFEYWYNEIREK